VAPDGIARASNGAAIKVATATKSAPAVRQILRETDEDVDAMIDGANDTANDTATLLAATNDSTTLVTGKDDGRRRMSEGQRRLAKQRDLHQHRRLSIKSTLPDWVMCNDGKKCNIDESGEDRQIDAEKTKIPKSAGTGTCYNKKNRRVLCADKIGWLKNKGQNALARVSAKLRYNRGSNEDGAIGHGWWPEGHFGLCWFTTRALFHDHCWSTSEWKYWDTVSGGIGKRTAVTLLKNEFMSQLGLSYATGRAGAMRFFDTAFRVSPAWVVCVCVCVCVLCECLCPISVRPLASNVCVPTSSTHSLF